MVAENSRSLKNSIGMFDLFKGVGMLMVVFGHTASLFQFPDLEGNRGMILVVQLLVQIFQVGLMPAFFLVSGYGFRRRPLKKCVSQQASLILRPYCYVAVLTVLLHLVLHYLSFGYWQGAVRETGKLAVGFLLALPQNKEMFDTVFFSCGAIWYLVALFLSWTILDWIMERLPERYVGIGVAGSVLLGWLTGRNRVIPFCLSQGLIAAGELYFGYRIKKEKRFTRPLTWHWLAGGGAAVLLSLLITTSYGKADNMADGVWALGPFSIVLDCFLGYILLHLFLKLNAYRNRLFDVIAIIGRYSLLIFAVHTVEMLAVPWYLFAERWKMHPIVGVLLQFALRSLLIFAACAVIRNWKKIRQGFRRKKQ